MHTFGRAALAAALALVTSLSLAPVAAAQSETPGPVEPTPRSTLAQPEVFGFLPYWELSRGPSVDLDVLTTLAFFGVEAGRDGRLMREDDEGQPTPGWAGWTSEEFALVRERAQAAGVRVVLTVERFSWTTAGKRATRRLLRDADARATLAREIVEVVVAAGADGVNLDVEPLPRGVRGQFVRLVRKLRRALDAVDPSLQLTFDLTPDVTSFPLRRLVAEGAADAAVLMGYEYRTPSSRIAGSVAPLRDPDGLDVRTSIRRALQRAAADKVILAMPWYGRAWSTRTNEPDSRTRQRERFIAPSTAFYRVSVPRAAIAGRRWDKQQGSAWSVYRSRACATCPLSWRQLWYDDVDSVLAKVGLARRRDLRGVGIWALGYEGQRPELWAALRYGLQRAPDGHPPVGEASVDPGSVIGSHAGRPVVGQTAMLRLSASDGDDGSGLAFVRLSSRGRLAKGGALQHGTTFPSVGAVGITLPDAVAVGDVFIPGGADGAGEADASPAPSAAPSPPAASELEPVTIHVQWRDVAGNWSAPVSVKVWLDPRA